MCGGAGLLASGCSLSFPISGFVADTTPTGSIDQPTALLSRKLDQEDWRRAKAALGVALDPQGNGALVSWANPATGSKGTFTASSRPVPEHDKICRAFLARVSPARETEREISGSACRDGNGDWAVAQATEHKSGS